MRFGILEASGRSLMRGAAVVLIGGLAAGCSSSVARFDSVDDIFTGSTANQRSIIKAPDYQPYPGDSTAQAPASNAYPASPARSAVEPAPIQRAALPAPGAASPSRTAVDTTPTGAVQASMPRPAPVATAASSGRAPGWSGAGGTQVTIRQGETVYNLSRRFGVPVEAIMRANGLSNADAIAAGQKIVIPAYTQGPGTSVSAPDANPKVASAKSSRGKVSDAPAQRLPEPAGTPDKSLAVLPQTPRVEERGTAQQASPKSDRVPAAGSAGGYTVAAGDSLYSIAKKTGTSTQALMATNGLKSPMLKIGQKLAIPAADVQATNQVAAAPDGRVDQEVTGAVKPAPKVAEAEQARVEPAAYTPPRKLDKVVESAVQNAAIAPDSTGVDRMRWPVRGRVISAFGSPKSGDGIDIAVPAGTPVKAAENGVVIYAGNGLKEFGNTVLVRHENGLVTVYGHASELTVERGQKVQRGQEIARSGMTGSADTPKLHFEVRKDSAPVDPAKFLE